MNVTDTKPRSQTLSTTPEAATPGEKAGTTTSSKPQNKLLEAVTPTTSR